MTDTLSQAEQHFERAASLEEQQDFQAALEECEATIRLDPGFAEAHNFRGMILESLGRQEEAILAYREAVRLDPAFEDAQANLRDAESELLENKYKAQNDEEHQDRETSAIAGAVVGVMVGLFSGVVLLASGANNVRLPNINVAVPGYVCMTTTIIAGIIAGAAGATIGSALGNALGGAMGGATIGGAIGGGIGGILEGFDASLPAAFFGAFIGLLLGLLGGFMSVLLIWIVDIVRGNATSVLIGEAAAFGAAIGGAFGAFAGVTFAIGFILL